MTISVIIVTLRVIKYERIYGMCDYTTLGAIMQDEQLKSGQRGSFDLNSKSAVELPADVLSKSWRMRCQIV